MNAEYEECEYAKCAYCGCDGMLYSKHSRRYYCEECNHSQKTISGEEFDDMERFD